MANTEKTEETWLYDECKRRGGFAIKLDRIIGIPDRLIVLPNNRIGFIETKTIDGRLSPMQQWWRRKLSKLGVECAGLRTKATMTNFLDDLEK